MINIVQHSHRTATADIAIDPIKEINIAASHASEIGGRAKIALRPPLQKLAELSYDSTPLMHSSVTDSKLSFPVKEGLPNPLTFFRLA